MMAHRLRVHGRGAGRDGGVKPDLFRASSRERLRLFEADHRDSHHRDQRREHPGPVVFGWLSDRFSRVRMLQVSLALSCVGTLWVAHLGPGVAMLFVSLLLYSAFTSSRGTQTQAIVADTASTRTGTRRSALYFLLGFLSQPFWVLVTGLPHDNAGFATALTVRAGRTSSGILVLFLMKDARNPRVVDPARAG